MLHDATQSDPVIVETKAALPYVFRFNPFNDTHVEATYLGVKVERVEDKRETKRWWIYAYAFVSIMYAWLAWDTAVRGKKVQSHDR
jgi:hypothetical protein